MNAAHLPTASTESSQPAPPGSSRKSASHPGRYTFEASQWLPYPVPRVFAFFVNPSNLPRLMPDWQKPRLDSLALTAPPAAPVGSQAAIAAGLGSRIALSFRPVPLIPVRLTWDAEIADFAWHDHFCDLQLTGPFAYWKHCHRVLPETRNNVPGTLLLDQVNYELPLAPLSALVQPLIRWQLQSAFNFRQKRTAELMAAPA